MPKFKKIGAEVPKSENAAGKNSRMEFLPSRHALDKLTGGNPWDRSFAMYAARTPSGKSAPNTYDDIRAMGELGIDLKK